MNRTRWIIAATALFASVLAAGVAFAHYGKHGHGPEALVDRVAERLELNDSQREQVQVAFDTHHEQFKALRQTMRDRKQNLIETLQGEYDEAAVGAEATAMADNVRQMIVLAGTLKRDVDAVLTAEQRAELNEMIERRMERGRHGWGHGGPKTR